MSSPGTSISPRIRPIRIALPNYRAVYLFLKNFYRKTVLTVISIVTLHVDLRKCAGSEKEVPHSLCPNSQAKKWISLWRYTLHTTSSFVWWRRVAVMRLRMSGSTATESTNLLNTTLLPMSLPSPNCRIRPDRGRGMINGCWNGRREESPRLQCALKLVLMRPCRPKRVIVCY